MLVKKHVVYACVLHIMHVKKHVVYVCV